MKDFLLRLSIKIYNNRYLIIFLILLAVSMLSPLLFLGV